MSTPDRPTSWWLATLRRRAASQALHEPTLRGPALDERERRAALAFFNAAFRAEESGLRQAESLAGEVERWDPELAEALRLYGAEEGWHRELLSRFLAELGGGVAPMGRVTRLAYRLYGRAERMESIVLANLMFETIGSTTYRLALRRVRDPACREMLVILTRDESFHVPLNVHFLRRLLERRSAAERRRLARLYKVLMLGLLLLPLASRPRAQAFDGLGRRELIRAYAEALAGLFVREPDLGLAPPRLLLACLGLGRASLASSELSARISTATAEAAADRATAPL